MTWVKICGVQEPGNARVLAGMDLNALGINRYESSSRYVDLSRAKELADRIRQVDPEVDVVGVYVNETIDDLREDHAAVDWDIIQLHGDETPDFTGTVSDLGRVMKAFRVGEATDVDSFGGFECWSYLLDAYHPDRYGGTGETAPWEKIRFLADDYRIVLAGGLTPENVVEAIETVGPWGVDVCSGVEDQQGLKDLDKVRQLLDSVRRHETSNSE